MALANLESAGVDLSHVAKVSVPTSIALVMVEESGENQIVIAKGANDEVTVDAASVSEADAVILQNEIPVEAMLEAARACTGLLCINAAPVRELPKELLERVDVLIVNEHEFAAYGEPTKGVVVLTKGKDEAIVYQDGEVKATATPPQVAAIDTVGAGDTFVGAFVVAMTSGMNLEDSLQQAVHAASLSTLANGAQSGMPSFQQVEEFMKKDK
jgi:ribokinase